jgi:hypothetical protein
MVAKGRLRPCPLPQGHQGHHNAWPILSRQLDHLPPTHQQWGGAPPRRHAVPVLLTKGSSVWHTTCPPLDMLMHIHGWWMPSMLSPLSSSIGINDTPFVNTWYGKPGVALQPHQSGAGNDASGLIAGLPSRPYIARSVSACSCYVVAHWHTLCQFGVITNHLQPRPTKHPTQKYAIIPSGIASSNPTARKLRRAPVNY